MRSRTFYESFPVTCTILALNLGLFALTLLLHHRQIGDLPGPLDLVGFSGRSLELLGSVSLGAVERGDWWRLIAAAFLHGGFIHLGLNAYMLWQVGTPCETRLGTWKYLVLYGAALLGGSLGSITWSWWKHDLFRSSVGASGAIFGLIGFFAGHEVRHGDDESRSQLLQYLITIAIFSLIMGGRIDHAGHVGGFIVGGLFGWSSGEYVTSREAERWRYPAYAVSLLVLVALVVPFLRYFRAGG